MLNICCCFAATIIVLSATNSYVTTNCLLLLDTDAWYFILYWILWYMTVTDSNELLYSPMMISSVMFWCLLTWFKGTSSLIRSYVYQTLRRGLSWVHRLWGLWGLIELWSQDWLVSDFFIYCSDNFRTFDRPENFLFVCRGVWCMIYGYES